MYCKWRPARSAILGIVETPEPWSQFTFFRADRLILIGHTPTEAVHRWDE